MAAEVRTYLSCPALNKINWGAVFSGVLVALFSETLLGLLGLAVGITAYQPGQDLSSIGNGSVAWIVVSVLISIFAGTYTAGRLSQGLANYDGMLHGIVTLSFLVVLSLYMATMGVANAVSNALAYGLDAVRTPQVQQMLPSTNQMKNQATVTPNEQQRMAETTERVATKASWIAFITVLLSLAAAISGGHLGKRDSLNNELSRSHRFEQTH